MTCMYICVLDHVKPFINTNKPFININKIEKIILKVPFTWRTETPVPAGPVQGDRGWGWGTSHDPHP